MQQGEWFKARFRGRAQLQCPRLSHIAGHRNKLASRLHVMGPDSAQCRPVAATANLPVSRHSAPG
jgi:hypothetical protein